MEAFTLWDYLGGVQKKNNDNQWGFFLLLAIDFSSSVACYLVVGRLHKGGRVFVNEYAH